MNPLGLSPDAVERRRKHICGGDAARIMAGEWRQVWREKRGLAAEPDLSGELRVQMGSFTEPFNLWWCEQVTGRPITYYSSNHMMLAIWQWMHEEARESSEELQVSEQYSWMACNLDGMTTTATGAPCVIDAKHVGKSDDAMILRYTAAGTHQATVMGVDWWALSVFVANNHWELIMQPVDLLYQIALIDRCREFWGYVARGEEPEDRIETAMLPPKPVPRLRIVRLEDEFKDAWPNWGGAMLPLIRTFAETEAAAKKHAIVRKEIGALLPEDVGEVTRGRFKARRDKAGAVRMAMSRGEE